MSLSSLTDRYTQARDCGDGPPSARQNSLAKAGLATPANLLRLRRTRYIGLTSGLPPGCLAAGTEAESHEVCVTRPLLW